MTIFNSIKETKGYIEELKVFNLYSCIYISDDMIIFNNKLFICSTVSLILLCLIIIDKCCYYKRIKDYIKKNKFYFNISSLKHVKILYNLSEYLLLVNKICLNKYFKFYSCLISSSFNLLYIFGFNPICANT